MKYTVYHGTNAEFDMFSPEYTGKGNDQIGSGFYFADRKEIAERYGNNILKCEIEINNPIRLTKEHANLRDINLHLNKKQVADIIKLSPNIYDMDETPLWNYSDISGYSKEDLDFVIDGIAEDFVENEYDNLMYLENDFYRDYSTEFRTAINKVLGYDGVIQTFDDGNFYVCWFPEQIKILETITESEELNDAFYKWFGNSKVVDKNGKPLEVYHGSTEEFDAFEGGAFFTDDYMNADGYGAGENIYDCYLKIERPLIIDCKGQFWRELDTPYGTTTQEIVSNADKNKYDGVIFENINDCWIDDAEVGSVCTVYFVFNQNQIKSVDNKGTWSTSSSNIYESLNREIERYL